MQKSIIRVQNLTKTYRSYSKPIHRLIERLSGNKVQRHMLKYALDDVSFELMPGDRLGIMGENGSGKSTLLKILSGVLTPTGGEVAVNGKVAALLELGTGFHPDLTGKENVFQNGYIMGYSEEEMQERYPEIADFSELGEGIEYPVRGYSSGMLMRLAFACSVFVEPDILIVDEALAVGDAYFQTKCFYKIKSLIENGTTFLYVSHGQDAVRTLCNKAIVLEKGKLIREGVASEVADFYTSYMYAKKASLRIKMVENTHKEQEGRPLNDEESNENSLYSHNESFMKRVESLRQGNGFARITDVQMLDIDGKENSLFSFGEQVVVRVHFFASVMLSPNFSLGVGVVDNNGVVILQCSTIDRGIDLHSSADNSKHIVDLSFKNILCQGDYKIVAGLGEMQRDFLAPHYTTKDTYDLCFGCTLFSVSIDPEVPIWGKVFHDFKILSTEIIE